MIIYSLFPVHLVFISYQYPFSLEVKNSGLSLKDGSPPSPFSINFPQDALAGLIPRPSTCTWQDLKPSHPPKFITKDINAARIGWRKRRWIGRSNWRKAKGVILLGTLTNVRARSQKSSRFFWGEGGRVIRELTCPTKREKEHHRLRVLPWEKDMWSFPGGYINPY